MALLLPLSSGPCRPCAGPPAAQPRRLVAACVLAPAHQEQWQVAPGCAAERSQTRHQRRAPRCQALPSPSSQQGQAEPPPTQEDEEFVGLSPEEDQEVPGGMTEATNTQTRLGKAISAACKELSHLNSMEVSNLQQADALLKKLGFKNSLMPRGMPVFAEEEEDLVEKVEEEASSGEGQQQQPSKQ